MKKWLTGILSVLILTASMVRPAHADGELVFSDVKSGWAKPSIENAVKKGYVTGYPDGTFKPDAQVTYAEFMKMMVTAMDLKVEKDDSNWYRPYLQVAAGEGIYRNDFKDDVWNKPIPRIDMARIAFRATREDTKAAETAFNKNRFMYEATAAGLINGYGNGQIKPDGKTTRAESISVIERVLSVRGGQKLKADKYAQSAAEVLWHRSNLLTVLPRIYGNPMGAPSANYWDGSQFMWTGDNGNYTCGTEKYLAIDLDDKNDPNLKLIPKDLQWRDEWTGKKRPIPRSGAYLLIAFNTFEIKKHYKTTYQYCEVGTAGLDISGSNYGYEHAQMDAVFAITSPSQKMNLSFDSYNLDKKTRDTLMKQKYVSGLIFPKGKTMKGSFYNEVTLVFSGPSNFGADPQYQFYNSIVKN